MPNEELAQRGYYDDEGLRGDRFGSLEVLDLGATSLTALMRAGLRFALPRTVEFPFSAYSPPKSIGSAKPDRIAARRGADGLQPVAVLEMKAPREIDSAPKKLKAAEQAVFYGGAMSVAVAAFTNGTQSYWVDVASSLAAGEIVYLGESRQWGPSVLDELLSGSPGLSKDPTELAEAVWQVIWHATKAEPKECLLTFVEIFMLKFLSDNLPAQALPNRFRFETLLADDGSFLRQHGKLQIDYYVSDIRPKIKALFPDNTIVDEPGLPEVFGLSTLVSKTSIINGFAFLQSSDQGLATFNRTFGDILEAFQRFGALTTIDPEFKLRLYETFLRRSARQQRLGQFFTPRNIVRPIIRMAQLGRLPDGAVVLDPAAGVGGFVLEPLLFPDSLPGNISFGAGTATRRVRTVGIDVDKDLHILAKANTLLHLAEAVRDPAITMPAMNKAMANTMVLMNEHEMLGSLLNPPRGSVDVIMTNPPYVTKGSSIYRDAAAAVSGHRNGTDLRDFYDVGGLGVEALFLRYISGALKPGGTAFVIVPLGLLNRSEPRPKRHLLDECNVVASIALPRKAFFNTTQPTYILVLERRHTAADPRPDVFCAIARTTGETLDSRRTPTPGQNDLACIAEAFVRWRDGDPEAVESSDLIKIEPATEFGDAKRWDVPRFWNDDELVSLGVRVPPIERAEFVDEVAATLRDLLDELDQAQAELLALSPDRSETVSIGNHSLFEVRSGKRVRHQDVLAHPGDLPVYSCFTRSTVEKGRIDEQWALDVGAWIIDAPTVTVNATGASGVGIVFVRETRSMITDDVIAIVPTVDDIDVHYLASALTSVIALGDFQYEAKLYQGRIKQLTVDIPARHEGGFDLELQRAIGRAVTRVEQIKDRITDLGVWTKAARLV